LFLFFGVNDLIDLYDFEFFIEFDFIELKDSCFLNDLLVLNDFFCSIKTTDFFLLLL
jgi:hypothetical protein